MMIWTWWAREVGEDWMAAGGVRWVSMDSRAELEVMGKEGWGGGGGQNPASVEKGAEEDLYLYADVKV